MSSINITNINVLNNPALFQSPFAFEVTFECIVPIKEGKKMKGWVEKEGGRKGFGHDPLPIFDSLP